jgi:hypothetical protein
MAWRMQFKIVTTTFLGGCMRTHLKLNSAGALTLMTVSAVTFAQGVAPPPQRVETPVPQGLAYDPQQFPAIRGEIERLTLTARGDIDGFILKDGTEVKTAPDLSTQIALAIKPGDRVTVHGLKAAALPLVSAVSVTDEATHRTVTDSGASAPMNPPPPPALIHRGGPALLPGASSEMTGRVRMALHGPRGEVNGALLDSGAILRFPPDQGAQLSALIEPRQTVVAEGIAISNALGTVVEVQQIGPSRTQLVAVGPPSPPLGDRGSAGPRRRPPPPADGAPQPPPPPEGAASGPAAPSPPAPPAS